MARYGFTTGAFSFLGPDEGLAISHKWGLPIVEVSSLSEGELPLVIESVRKKAHSPMKVSVHGPALKRQMPEEDLVQQLAGLDVPVVMHPYIFEDVSRWRALGFNLLVENSDGRKPLGQTSQDLDALFQELPQASMCLDISHALHAGGLPLALDLAARYRQRITQVHIGCASGQDVGTVFEPALLEACTKVLRVLPSNLRIISERIIDPQDYASIDSQVMDMAQLEQVRNSIWS